MPRKAATGGGGPTSPLGRGASDAGQKQAHTLALAFPMVQTESQTKRAGFGVWVGEPEATEQCGQSNSAHSLHPFSWGHGLWMS